MVSTFLSLIVSFIVAFTPFIGDLPYDSFLPGFLTFIAGVFIITSSLLVSSLWHPLQKAEQTMSPKVIEILHRSFSFRLQFIWLFAFPLITLSLAIVFLSNSQIPFQKSYLFAGWVILFGISLDLTFSVGKKILNYLNPYVVLEKLTREAKESIKNERELDLCLWIDAISEVALKAIQRQSLSLCNMALSEIQEILRLFFASSKSISYREIDKQSQELGISDKISYTSYYVYQRLEMAFEKALHIKMEPTCSHLITNLGKIAIEAAKVDISLAAPPLRFIGKFARRARKEGFEETVLKASCTLLMVGKIIIQEIDVTYLEIQDPFLTITNTLEELAKEAFRQDKTIEISLVITPLLELRDLFQSERVKNHRDTPAILASIDRVLGEFEALKVILKTLPDISQITQDQLDSP